MTVLSLGVSGNSGADSAEQSLEVLRRWLDAHPEWKEVHTSPSPPPRVLNYNDPFTRPQWSEVQVVVERGA
jgi:hypothetical protein